LLKGGAGTNINTTQEQTMPISKSILTESSQVKGFFDSSEQEPFLGFDIECQSLDPKSPIAGLSLYAPDQERAVYIPLHHLAFKAPTETRNILRDRLPKFPVKTYNGGFDTYRFELHFGATPTIVGDALIVSKMLQLHKFGLKDLSQDLGISENPIRLSDILGDGNYDFTLAPLRQKTLDYTTQDAILAVQVEDGLMRKYFKPEHHPGWDTVYRLELDIMLILERAGQSGIPVDREKFNHSVAAMFIEMESLTQDICSELGRNSDTFKIASWQQLSSALYNTPDHKPSGSEKTPAQIQMAMPGLGLECPTPKRSVDDSVLAQLEEQHQVITKIRRWKTLNSVLTRDLPNLHKYAQSGEIRPQFAQIGEDGTARIYTREPNAICFSMNVRKAMPPRPGKVYAHCDYKAAEWRLVALLSGEQKILQALDSGVDPHKFTYSQMTGTPLDQIDHEKREQGKVLNYAPLYGAGAYRVSRSLKSTQEYAQQLLDQFWDTYPILDAWFKERQEYARKHARTFTVLGRSRDLRQQIFISGDSNAKKKALRRAVNTSGQGSCGDVLKLALRNIDRLSREPNHPLQLANTTIKCPVFDAVLLEMDERAMDPDCLSISEAAIREAMDVELEYQGRKTVMRSTIGWSKTSWAQACGKD
jgi:DNA polymerase-1